MISNDNQNLSPIAFAAKANQNNKVQTINNNFNRRFNNSNKEKPFCTHCKLQGHTVEKCYKHHWYPPGYKPKARSNHVNVVVTNDNITIDNNQSISDDLRNMFRGFS